MGYLEKTPNPAAANVAGQSGLRSKAPMVNALVTSSSDALVPGSFLLLVAMASTCSFLFLA